MGSPTVFLLLGAAVVMAVFVAMLVARRPNPRQGEAWGRGAGNALVVGLIVLALASLNVIQFTAGFNANSIAAPSAADLKTRAEQSQAKQLSTPLLGDAGEQEIVNRFANLFYTGEETCGTGLAGHPDHAEPQRRLDAPGDHRCPRARLHH